MDSAINTFITNEALEREQIYFIKEASGKGLGKEVINFVSNIARNL
jgi:hypothetical protein